MSHKKASLTSHRIKGAAKKAESYAHAEVKSSVFDRKSKSGADAKLPSVNMAPYSAKPGVNKGRCVTRNEHLALYDLHNSVDSMRDEHLEDIEFFYKVMCSAKRHMPLKKLESYRNHEGDSLVISTHKFLRMYEQRYKRPPPRSTMTNNTRMAYANSVCNYHVTKGGTVIPGAYYNPLTDPPIGTIAKTVPAQNIQVKSALNGANGSVTGTDDVDNNTSASFGMFSSCTHPWCKGVLRRHNGKYLYCFSVDTEHTHFFANHWRHHGVCVIRIDLNHEDQCDDCMCIACTLATVHTLHLAPSCINGNNGSYTNTDDHDSPVTCDATSCKLGVHYHKKANKPTSGAAQRIAERTAAKDTPKPVGELVKCVNETGVPIPCACCSKPATRYHLPRKSGVKKSDPVSDAKVNDAEKEQGLLDAERELSVEEYDHTESGAAGGGPEPIILCTVIEQPVKSKKTVTEIKQSPTITESKTGLFKGTPVMESVANTSVPFTFIEASAPPAEQIKNLELLPAGNVATATDCELADHLEDEMLWTPAATSPRSIDAYPDGPLVEISTFPDKVELRTIMVNTAIPPSHGLCRLIMVYLVQLVATIDRSPANRVRHVTRHARLTTTLTATVDNSWLRLIFPSSWTWEEETHENYDLMIKSFYNATIERDVYTKLYELGLSHFAFIPIGQYDPSKPVYSYFLARLITGMADVLGPERLREYHKPHRIQVVMNTYMALSNALVLYHYQLVKASGGG